MIFQWEILHQQLFLFVCFLGRSLTGSMFHCVCLVSWVFTSFAGFAQTFIFVCSLNQEKHRWKMYNNVQKVKTKRKILVKKTSLKNHRIALSLFHSLSLTCYCSELDVFPVSSLSLLSLSSSLCSHKLPRLDYFIFTGVDFSCHTSGWRLRSSDRCIPMWIKLCTIWKTYSPVCTVEFSRKFWISRATDSVTEKRWVG